MYHRSEKYLEFIRDMKCCATGLPAPSVAHHVRMNTVCGMGIKPSDYRCVPLAPGTHSILHQIGEREFFRKYGIDPEILISKLLLAYAKYENMSVIKITDAIAQVIHERNEE